MDTRTTTQPIGRRINYSVIYRVIMCSVACAVIFAAVALKLTRYFAPENLELMALDGYGSYTLPITLQEDEVMEPGKEGILKNQIYVVEEKTQSLPETAPKKESNASPVYPITETDLSAGAAQGDILIRDSDSGKSVDVRQLLSAPYPEALRDDGISRLSIAKEPLVLIVHTHATESFVDEGTISYTPGTEFRSEDTDKNMVAVGRVMAEVLNRKGIPTVHCETLHDLGDFNGAYDNSLATVKKYLAQYPSVKYVFDLHRDAIIRETGEALKPVCTIDGKPTAQVMTLVGTDAGGADHPLWLQNNMNLAVKLQHKLTTDYNGMARPINLRKLSFHQQYAPGYLLFEIGSCANTLEEAKNAAENLGNAIADVINNS